MGGSKRTLFAPFAMELANENIFPVDNYHLGLSRNRCYVGS